MSPTKYIMITDGSHVELVLDPELWYVIEQQTDENGKVISVRVLGTYKSMWAAQRAKARELRYRKALSVFGRRGGTRKTASKQAASQQNGKKGGRPKKDVK